MATMSTICHLLFLLILTALFSSCASVYDPHVAAGAVNDAPKGNADDESSWGTWARDKITESFGQQHETAKVAARQMKEVAEGVAKKVKDKMSDDDDDASKHKDGKTKHAAKDKEEEKNKKHENERNEKKKDNDDNDDSKKKKDKKPKDQDAAKDNKKEKDKDGKKKKQKKPKANDAASPTPAAPKTAAKPNPANAANSKNGEDAEAIAGEMMGGGVDVTKA